MTTLRPALGALRWLAAGTAVLLLGACSPVGRSREPAEYVPDKRLFAQIAEIEHVTNVSVEYSDDFGSGPLYDGDVRVDDTANLLCVADQVNAILWQGRIAGIAVYVEQGEKWAGAPQLGLNTRPTHDDVEWQKWIDRYGTHPSAGSSPAPSPGPTPPAGGPCG